MRVARTSHAAAEELPLWPPVLATRGPGGASARHAHHAMHLVVAIDGELAIAGDASGEPVRAAGVLTAPDVAHAIDARGTDVVLVFLDPESDAGAALHAALDGRASRVVTPGERAALAPAWLDPVRVMRDGGLAWSRELADILGASALPKRRVDPRVRRLLRHLQALPPGGDASLRRLAALVGLSEGRLMHVFTESIGLPLRPYLLWCKLQRAAAGVASGLPLSQAAVGAGFADAAHMTRAFRRMFGVPPSSLRAPERAK